MKNNKMILCIMVSIALAFLTACQPTPEQEVVVGQESRFYQDDIPNVDNGKSSGKSDDIQYEKIEVPEYVKADKTSYKNISITVDADVVVPDTANYPITEVGKIIFTDDYVINKMEELTGSSEFYSDWTPDKNYWLKKIAEAKRNIGKDGVTDEFISFLQNEYDNAPANASQTKLDLSQYESGQYYRCFAKSNDGSVALFNVEKDENFITYSSNQDETIVEKGISDADDWTYPGMPALDEKDALKEALVCMENMGADLDLLYAEPCSINENGINKSTGWIFTFTRKIAGMQSNFAPLGFYINPISLPSVGGAWQPEVFRVAIGEDGIYSILWQGASKITSTVTDSVELEDFDAIQKRATDQIRFNYDTDMSLHQVDFTITEFALGICNLSVPNQKNVGQYVPTWTITFDHEDDEGIIYHEQLVLNAIDGSYVEPRKTTNEIMELAEKN